MSISINSIICSSNGISCRRLKSISSLIKLLKTVGIKNSPFPVSENTLSGTRSDLQDGSRTVGQCNPSGFVECYGSARMLHTHAVPVPHPYLLPLLNH